MVNILFVITAVDRVGLLKDLSTVFANYGFNIEYIYTAIEDRQATVVFLVSGDGDIESVVSSLEELDGIESVAVEREWQDVLQRLADLLQKYPDMIISLAKRLDFRDLAVLVTMVNNGAELLKLLPTHQVVAVLEHVEPKHAAGFLEKLEVRTAAQIVENMALEKVVDILQNSTPSLRHTILQRISPAMRQQVRSYLRYDPESVGGIMRLAVPYVKMGDSVEKALEVARSHDSDIVYVVNHEGQLLGMVEIYDILEKGVDIDKFLQTPKVVLTPKMDREAAARLFIRHGIRAAPVVTEDGRLIGYLRVDDIIDVILKEATEDMLKLEAIIPFGNYQSTKPFEIFKKRAFALIFIFLVESITASIIKAFENVIEAVAIAVAFMPLIAHMSGSVGSQASTIITRAIALGEVATTSRGVFRVLIREFTIGVLLGISMASIGVGFAAIISSSLKVAAAVAIALLLVIMWINFVGSLLPIIMFKIGVDPAVISGPLITTIGDIVGITTYFVTVSILL
ncbi:MAG: magnesium transporter [Pyrobaculum sp.]